ncbi:MAG: TrmH family RNA methyltransferase [Bacteroidota bacterium]|jgi:TrmH family RNA methyltransferase
MASKSTISFLRSLQQKKFRNEEGLFIVEGPKMVSEVLKSDFKVKQLYATSNWTPDQNTSLPIEILSDAEMERVSGLQTPNKVMAVVELPILEGPVNTLSNGLHLLLDQIQDPGNLGTIIRIADWFGVSSVICSSDTADVFNPKVIQASMGSVFNVKVHYSSLADVLLKNANGNKWPVYATLLTGEEIYNTGFAESSFVILGNESRGVNPILNSFITKGIHIPRPSNKPSKAESLNVAVAAGIVCSEYCRKN